ncbi:MAG: hypothetical protein V3V08_18350 [Nannocystaceae bacterium]
MTLNLLAAYRDPSTPVAVDGTSQRSAAQLAHDAAAVRDALPPPSPGSQIALVFRSDRYAFAAAFCGAWWAGHGVALPPDTSRATMAVLLALPRVVALAHDTHAGGHIRVPELLTSGRGTTTPEIAWPCGPAISTFFSRDAKGALLGHPRSGTQLRAETAVYSRVCASTPQATWVSAISPTTPFGFLLGVLLPLRQGARFHRAITTSRDTIRDALTDSAVSYFIATPTFLERLEESERGDSTTAIRPAQILCTASLTRATSAHFDPHGAPASTSETDPSDRITELLGSAETGGFAYRRGSHWKPLPHVRCEVDENGCLAVASPFFGLDSLTLCHTRERAQTSADGFVYLGPADDRIFLGGDAFSARGIEGTLRSIAGITDVAVFTTVASDGPHLFALICAATHTSDTLRARCAALLPPPVAPALSLRKTATIPRDTDGNPDRSGCMRHFNLRADGTPLSTTVRWGTRRLSRDGATCRHLSSAQIPPDYAFFDGHFPGYPVMAGIVQLHELVVPCLRVARPDLGGPREFTRVKFTGRIGPGDALQVQLTWNEGQPWVDFLLSRGCSPCASGRLGFEQREAEDHA